MDKKVIGAAGIIGPATAARAMVRPVRVVTDHAPGQEISGPRIKIRSSNSLRHVTLPA